MVHCILIYSFVESIEGYIKVVCFNHLLTDFFSVYCPYYEANKMSRKKFQISCGIEPLSLCSHRTSNAVRNLLELAEFF